MTEILKIENLTKNFGRITAVSDLNLEISSGQVFGILGPNGSGKTTTLGMILDIVAPSKGNFKWFGGIKNVEARKKIGSILETPCFYPYLSAEQNLKIVAHIKECDESRIPIVIEQVNLTDRKSDKFKTYSLGMKQRLSIAAAMLSDPPVLILDEPTNGLDPEGIAEVRTIIKDIAEKDKTIIMASHLLDEVQKVCTDFCVLRKGRKLHQGKVHEILGDTNRVEIQGHDMPLLDKKIRTFEGVERVSTHNGTLTLELKSGFDSSNVNEFCHNHGINLKMLLPQKHSLEEEFLKILKEND